jgi:DNA polymerase elongation subunit (family B)
MAVVKQEEPVKQEARTKRRRLYFDIETSPNIGLFWSAGYKQRIDYSNIIEERKIICICYKWEEEDVTYSLQWDSKQCDKRMLNEFIKVANHADEMVGHNGDKFDLTWIRTRCLFHGIEMFPKYTTIDTLKIARQQFRFNSNKLDYIAKYLGVGAKKETTFGLWKEVLLHKNKESLAYMVEYCKEDVRVLEKVFIKLQHHAPHKTHYGVVFNHDRGSCPGCGSDEIIKQRNKVTAAGMKYVVFRCKTCNKYHQKIDK